MEHATHKLLRSHLERQGPALTANATGVVFRIRALNLQRAVLISKPSTWAVNIECDSDKPSWLCSIESYTSYPHKLAGRLNWALFNWSQEARGLSPWRTSPTPTRRPGPSSAGSGRRSALAACRRSAARWDSAPSEQHTAHSASKRVLHEIYANIWGRRGDEGLRVGPSVTLVRPRPAMTRRDSKKQNRAFLPCPSNLLVPILTCSQ